MSGYSTSDIVLTLRPLPMSDEVEIRKSFLHKRRQGELPASTIGARAGF
jgi:hypothetical protein